MAINLPPKDPAERRLYGYNATARDAVTETNKITAVVGETTSGDVELEDCYPNPDGVSFSFVLLNGTPSDDANLVKFWYTLQDGQILDDTVKVKIKLR